MTARTFRSPPTRPAAASGTLITSARFVALLYLFVIAGLLAATLAPALVFQWRPLAVVSGSMQPTIRPGAMVLVDAAVPDRYYEDRTIVAYADRARAGRLVTHRVVAAATNTTGAVSYTTKGDANEVPDSGPVPHDDVTGSVRMIVPFVGMPALWLHHRRLPALAAWGLGSLLAVATVVPGRRS